MKSIKYILPIAALALSAIATAGTRADTRVVVKYGDLNLKSDAGIASLHHRIRNAAETVCGQYETRLLALREQYLACVEDAVNSSVAAVGNARLTRYNLGQGRSEAFAALR